MTQPEPKTPLSPDMNRILDANPSNANLIYILYLVALLLPVTVLVGLIMAYLNRSKAPDWLTTHYSFLIRTFWMGLLYAVICFFTTFILIGFVLYLVLFAWYIVRLLNGMQALGQREAIKNHTRWGF